MADKQTNSEATTPVSTQTPAPAANSAQPVAKQELDVQIREALAKAVEAPLSTQDVAHLQEMLDTSAKRLSSPISAKIQRIYEKAAA
jgi:hypothetical protein